MAGEEPASEAEATESEDVEETAPAPMEPLPLRGRARPEPMEERVADASPLDRANEALARAAAARGAELTPLPVARSRRHPLEAANEALEAARQAREHAVQGGTRGQQRQAEARAQLDALKRTGGRLPETPPPTDAGDDGTPPAPRKRRL